jgi:hypothetical protein
MASETSCLRFNIINPWNIGSSAQQTSHVSVVRSIDGIRVMDSFWGQKKIGTSGFHKQSSRSGMCGIETLLVFGTRTIRLDLGRFVHGESLGRSAILFGQILPVCLHP